MLLTTDEAEITSDGPAAPGSDLYAQGFLIRAVERRLLDLFAEGKLSGTVHTCIGQEWTGVAVAAALRPGDRLFSNHRCHGHYLAWTGDVDGLVAEVMGRQTGMCGGRGGSQHICNRGFYSNGIQGGIVPVAAGIALAAQLDRAGAVSVVFIGDGTLGEGAVYETMNVAAKWALPLLIVLENNRYAQSTAQRQTLAGEVGARAAAFGIPTGRSSTENPERLVADVAGCVASVRSGRGPFFLHVDTYRLMAHSKGDDDRDPDEVRRAWARDPLVRFAAARPGAGADLEAGARRRVDAAVARAEAAPAATAAAPPAAPAGPPVWTPTVIAEPDRVVNRIHAALRAALARDPKVILLGEDIEGPYGGAFKVTKDLSLEYPGRVRNMPISEAAVVGLGNGLALSGYRPVCEIMFGDFLTLAFDQFVNHAAKFRFMYNDQVRTPLIVRTPMGGRRGYGPTHSQSLEKHFLGVPDTRVLALHGRYDPARLYADLFASPDLPALVIENKLLYGTRVHDRPPAGFVLEHTAGPFPTTRLRPRAAPDLTLVCYGGMLAEAEAAAEILFDEHDLAAEVVCPAQLYPLDLAPIRESVARTGALVVAEEGQEFAGFGAEVVAALAAAGIPFRVARVGPPALPIPATGPLEKEWLPGAAHLVRAARGVCERV